MKHWAMNYDKCKLCHSTDTPHHGNGLCARCYHKQYQRKQRTKGCSLCKEQYATGRYVGRNQIANAITAKLQDQGLTCEVHTNTLYIHLNTGTLTVDINEYGNE